MPAGELSTEPRPRKAFRRFSKETSFIGRQVEGQIGLPAYCLQIT
jgi:hypothetical protein